LKGPEGGLNLTKYRTPLVPTAVTGSLARTLPFLSTTLILNEPGFTDSAPATVINALVRKPIKHTKILPYTNKLFVAFFQPPYTFS
jgi:hypothetical protein